MATVSEVIAGYLDAAGIGHVFGYTDPDVAYGLGRLVARDKALRTVLAMTMASGSGPASSST